MTPAATSSSAYQREVARVYDPAPTLAGTPGHTVRRLIGSNEAASADPFLLMAEDWMPHGAFAVHPHRGIETVTFVVEGAIEHSDNAGHRGVVGAGDAQWMTAGAGVLHDESALPGTVAHTLQLWVNLPAALKMTPPRYQDLSRAEAPSYVRDGVEVRVFSGQSGDVAARTLNHVPILMLEVRLPPGAATELDLPGADNAFLFVLEGNVDVGTGGAGITRGQLAWFTRPDGEAISRLALRGRGEACRLLLFSGPPLREPVVFGGPFVMNTHAEIQQAFRDFSNGRF